MSYQISRDPFVSVSEILSGFRGQTFMETGYVYAPFVSSQVSPLFISAHKKAKLASLKVVRRRGMITKHDKKATQSDFHTTVSIKDEDHE